MLFREHFNCLVVFFRIQERKFNHCLVGFSLRPVPLFTDERDGLCPQCLV